MTLDRTTAPGHRTAMCALFPDNVSRLIAFTPLVGATFLAKLSIPQLAGKGLGVFFPLTTLALLLGLLTRRLRLVGRRLSWFLLAFCFIAAGHVARIIEFSAGSIAFLFLVGLNYTVESSVVEGHLARNVFRKVAIVIALLGLLQFWGQFAIGQNVFPIEQIVPDAWRTQKYANIIPLSWKSTIFKSNGVVMLEPSEFSQLCAVGLLNELCGAFHPYVLLLFVAALVASYSGTGILILGVTLPFLVFTSRGPGLALRGAATAIGLAALAEPLHLDVTLRRAHEFESQGSSGYGRFVSWKNVFAPNLWDDFATILIGHGAGNSEHEAMFAKLLFEYGLLGGLTYLAFALLALMRAHAPLPLRVAVVMCCFVTNGAYSSWANGLALSLLVWPRAPALPADLSYARPIIAWRLAPAQREPS